MSKNLKLKKVIKSFIPEPISCFLDSYMRMNIMNIVNVFRMSISHTHILVDFVDPLNVTKPILHKKLVLRFVISSRTLYNQNEYDSLPNSTA